MDEPHAADRRPLSADLVSLGERVLRCGLCPRSRNCGRRHHRRGVRAGRIKLCPAEWAISALSCPSVTVCYGVGGTAIATTDGGATWATQTIPPNDASVASPARRRRRVTHVGNYLGTGMSSLPPTVGRPGQMRPCRPTDGLGGISCPSVTQCWVAGGFGPGAILPPRTGGRPGQSIGVPFGVQTRRHLVSLIAALLRSGDQRLGRNRHCHRQRGGDLDKSHCVGGRWIGPFRVRPQRHALALGFGGGTDMWSRPPMDSPPGAINRSRYGAQFHLVCIDE